MSFSDVLQRVLSDPLCICDLLAGLLLSGAALLALSLFFVRKLARELPCGINRTSWRLLGIFIMLFIVGYLSFYLMKRGDHYSKYEIVVPLIFFLGAVFVLMVCFLAYRTTTELKRMGELEQESITDPLMGIFNRRFLDRRLQEEVLRAKRHKLELAILLLDIDHFKRVNDTWGHQNGDIVLRHLARLLLDALRQTDLLARYGGEEFVVVLPHTTKQEAALLAERLRRMVAASPVALDGLPAGQQQLQVTVSIGISCLLAEDDTPDAIFERADRALYQAKQAGRNRVIGCNGLDTGARDSEDR